MFRKICTCVLAFSFCLFCHAQKKIKKKDMEKTLQKLFIMAKDGETIKIPKGKYRFMGSLSMDGKKNVTIKGAGMGKTTLSFKGQTEGAEGLKITNCSNITIEGMAIQDAKGDCIKAQDVEGITFRNLVVEWTGKESSDNGAYGIYPVQCENVLIEKCVAVASADAGIYVGQSKNIIVRQCIAYKNVAGIEIENSINADVYDNQAYDNTGGLLVFDLPGLEQKHGGNVRLYRNKVWNNNHENFGPEGTMVGKLPAGTGIIVMAAKNVEVFENEVYDNHTLNLAINSFLTMEKELKDKEYHPFPYAVYVHDNKFSRKAVEPIQDHEIGQLLFKLFGSNVPDIIYDGVVSPDMLGENQQLKPEYEICIKNNGDSKTAFLDLGNEMKNMSTEATMFDCEREPIKAVSIPE